MIELIKDLVFRVGLSDLDIELSRAHRQGSHSPAQPLFPTLVAPDPNKVNGFDMSGRWDGVADFSIAQANNFKFVYIKMADGTIKTAHFEENFAGAKGKLYRGVYVWLYPSDKVSVIRQVDAWWAIIKDRYPEMRIVIDFEWTYWGGLPANPSIGDLRAAVKRLYELSGRKPLVYTSVGFLGEVGDIPQDIIDMTEGVWAAHYGVAVPLIPPKYTTYKIHQWTDQLDGKYVGIAPENAQAVDANTWNGTLESLKEFTGDTGVPEPPTPGDGPIVNIKINL